MLLIVFLGLKKVKTFLYQSPGLRQPSVDELPPAALPGAKLLKKFDQNFLLPFGRLLYRHLHLDTAPGLVDQ